MRTLLLLVAALLQIYFFVLLARLVFDYVQLFARDWRPRGFLLVLAEAVYTLTDPPLRLLRRFIPPLRLGPVALDLSFFALFILVQVLRVIVSNLAYQV
ncbi:MAG: YggT family protein [Actinomycetes bacterium]